MCFIPRILLRTDGLIIKKAIEDDRSVSIGGTAFGICRVLFDMTETGYLGVPAGTPTNLVSPSGRKSTSRHGWGKAGLAGGSDRRAKLISESTIVRGHGEAAE